MQPRRRNTTLLLVAALLSVQAALGVSFARYAAPVWDEVPTLAQGLYLWRNARWDVPGSVNHPPLSWYLQSVPLALAGVDEAGVWAYDPPPEDARERLRWKGSYDPSRGQRILVANRGRLGEDVPILLGRLVTLAFTLAGGAALFLWSRRLHGGAGGLLSVSLWALSPNLIAHGSLATTDALLAVFALAASYAMFRAWERMTAGRLVAAGLLWGLGCLTKYTALILVVPWAAILAWAAWRREGPSRGDRPPDARGTAFVRAGLLLAGATAVAALTVAAGYQGNLSAYAEGIGYQRLNLEDGQLGFLHGEVSRAGWWYFYPVVLAIKTPLGEIALGLLGLFLWLRRAGPSTPLLFATLPFLSFVVLFVVEPLPVGVRYVLPVYVALQLAAGALLVPLRPRRALVAALLVGWVAVGTLRVHPHELAYFNETIGGPRNGWRWLVDSNLDWGQELKGLRHWMERRGVQEVQLGYFGSADPAYYGIRYFPLPSFPALRPALSEARQWPPRGWVAVSATCYWGLCYSGPPWEGNPYTFLHELEPVEQIGYSILVYDVP